MNNRHTQINILLLIILLVLAYKNINSFTDIKNNNNSISQINGSNKNKDNNKEIVLVKCVDGDTATFTGIGKTRFLLVDTPESTKKKEKYGKEASDFTCNILKKAKSITYEYDGEKKDKYDRTLAYIFVDNKLLQEEIAKQGYVKRFYLKRGYKYKYENRVRNSINDKYSILTKDSILY